MCGAYNVPVHAHFGSVIPSSPSSSQLNTFLFLSHGMRSMICIAFSVQQALYVDRGLMRSIRSQNGWRCVRDGEVSEVMRRGSVIRAQIWSRRAIRNYQLPAITNYQLHQPLSALPIAKYVTSMSSRNNISWEQQQHMEANQSSRQVRDIVWR